MVDSCGVCGGDDDCAGCDGVAHSQVFIDCAGVCGGSAVVDECSVCGGSGIAAGRCDCAGNVNDCAGVCGGSATYDECGVCGGPGIVAGTCNCAGDVTDCTGVCGGAAARVSCTPATCGIIDDGCGGTTSCGGCGPYYECDDPGLCVVVNRTTNRCVCALVDAHALRTAPSVAESSTGVPVPSMRLMPCSLGGWTVANARRPTPATTTCAPVIRPLAHSGTAGPNRTVVARI